MEDRARRYALRLLRAMREQHSNVHVGMWVTPYAVPRDAGLDPDRPLYEEAIDCLVAEEAIEWAEETVRAAGDPIFYRIKQRGIEMMEGVE
jgi:hypothetical protein